MTDITPLQAIEKLFAKDDSENSLLIGISLTLGSMAKKSSSDQWKQKLREELVREHLAARQKKEKPVKSFVQSLLKPKRDRG